MQAGELNRRVTIQRAAITKDAVGGEIQTWATYATFWASLTPVSADEKTRADELAAAQVNRFKVRWSSLSADVGPKDRLVYAGSTFEIVGVKEIGFREGVEITAAARAE